MGETRLDKLKELEKTLYATMQDCEPRELAAIARQYRETIREIEEIEGAEGNDDEVAEILQKRDNDGRAGAVRKNSA
jgi:hypothetical protein